MAIFLRPGKTPDGAEVARVLRHVVRHIRVRWPRVGITVRGDSHYGRIEAMMFCERARVTVACKLAVILHRMWADGSAFRWGKQATVPAATA